VRTLAPDIAERFGLKLSISTQNMSRSAQDLEIAFGLDEPFLIANLTGAAKLPAMYPFSEFVDAGGLIAYSFDLVELNKRVATTSTLSCAAQIPARSPTIRLRIRASDQRQDRESPWAHRTGDAARRRRQGDRMKRREFMATLGGVAAWPCRRRDPMPVLSSRAEQRAE